MSFLKMPPLKTQRLIAAGRDRDCFDAIATGIETAGYVVLSDALPEPLVDTLFLHFKSLSDQAFKQAGIGRQFDFHVNQAVRRDTICWLDRSQPVSREYLDWAETLRSHLNRRLFLGLFDYECHYAYYPRGAFYKRHLDAFCGRPNRVVSTLLYLNPSWCPEDGGELRMYRHPEDDVPFEVITPQYGKLVVFLSEVFPHEVMTVHRPRYSIAGWFRINNSLGVTLDPPK